MINRTFIVTGITLVTAVLFFSFFQTEFGFGSYQNVVTKKTINPVVTLLPENLAGVYKGTKPYYLINTSEQANLSPGARRTPGKKILNFIIIETGVIWLAEADSKDSTMEHYEGNYSVLGTSGSSIEIKANFWMWNKQTQSYYIKFDLTTGKAAAKAPGEPEFELIYIE